MVFEVVDKAKAQFPDVEVQEWNLADHPHLGPHYGVTATPAIVVNGTLEFRGVPSDKAFLERLVTIGRIDGN